VTGHGLPVATEDHLWYSEIVSTFRYEARVVTCANCGAPVTGGTTAGEVTCGYCGTANQIVARDDRRDQDAAASAPQISEAQRIERLREQDRRGPELPTSIMHHFVGRTIAPQAVEEARAAWQAARRELSAGAGSASAASERLYHLTLGLTAHLARQEQHDRERALVESALDLLNDATYRQVLHGMLSRAAALEGDLDAAGQWLALCSPHSEDLPADSAYRVSCACVFAGRKDGAGVLSVLGSNSTDVPLAAEHEDLCLLLRAHAHELAGQQELAVEQLKLRLLHEDGPQGVEAAWTKHAALALCPVALPRARAERDRLRSELVRARGHNWVGFMVVLGIVGGVALGGALGLWVHAALGIVAGVLGFCAPFLLMVLEGSSARQRGIRGHADIVQVDLHRAGRSVYSVFYLLVQLPRQATYFTRLSVGGSSRAWVQGAKLRVVVDRRRKSLFIDPAWY